MIRLNCHFCKQELEYADRVPLRDECSKCKHDVHSCKNCSFYDAKVYNECREPQAEVVMEKDRANRCEYYQPGRVGAGGASASAPSKEDLLKAAEALFKKKL